MTEQHRFIVTKEEVAAALYAHYVGEEKPGVYVFELPEKFVIELKFTADKPETPK